jgi:carbon-monoxide dehydrogenase medium subunit
MHVPDVELHTPSALAEAAELLAHCRPNVRLLAGGTDLLVDLKAGRATTLHLVSLGNVEALRGVAIDEAGLSIGAATTITHLIDFLQRDDAPRHRTNHPDGHATRRDTKPYAAILEAALQMASPQIRNMATVGGNVASAVPCADLPPILIAMNASAIAWSPNGEREIPMDEFFAGVRRTALRDNEILKALHVPTPPRGFGAAYERFALREGNGIAVASVAASVELGDGGVIRGLRIVPGAVAPVPKRVDRIEALLKNRCAVAETPGSGPVWDPDVLDVAAGAAMESAEPISDIRASAEFRRELVGILTRRALTRALRRART